MNLNMEMKMFYSYDNTDSPPLSILFSTGYVMMNRIIMRIGLLYGRIIMMKVMK